MQLETPKTNIDSHQDRPEAGTSYRGAGFGLVRARSFCSAADGRTDRGWPGARLGHFDQLDRNRAHGNIHLSAGRTRPPIKWRSAEINIGAPEQRRHHQQQQQQQQPPHHQAQLRQQQKQQQQKHQPHNRLQTKVRANGASGHNAGAADNCQDAAGKLTNATPATDDWCNQQSGDSNQFSSRQLRPCLPHGASRGRHKLRHKCCAAQCADAAVRATDAAAAAAAPNRSAQSNQIHSTSSHYADQAPQSQIPEPQPQPERARHQQPSSLSLHLDGHYGPERLAPKTNSSPNGRPLAGFPRSPCLDCNYDKQPIAHIGHNHNLSISSTHNRNHNTAINNNNQSALDFFSNIYDNETTSAADYSHEPGKDVEGAQEEQANNSSWHIKFEPQVNKSAKCNSYAHPTSVAGPESVPRPLETTTRGTKRQVANQGIRLSSSLPSLASGSTSSPNLGPSKPPTPIITQQTLTTTTKSLTNWPIKQNGPIGEPNLTVNLHSKLPQLQITHQDLAEQSKHKKRTTKRGAEVMEILYNHTNIEGKLGATPKTLPNNTLIVDLYKCHHNITHLCSTNSCQTPGQSILASVWANLCLLFSSKDKTKKQTKRYHFQMPDSLKNINPTLTPEEYDRALRVLNNDIRFQLHLLLFRRIQTIWLLITTILCTVVPLVVLTNPESLIIIGVSCLWLVLQLLGVPVTGQLRNKLDQMLERSVAQANSFFMDHNLMLGVINVGSFSTKYKLIIPVLYFDASQCREQIESIISMDSCTHENCGTNNTSNNAIHDHEHILDYSKIGLPLAKPNVMALAQSQLAKKIILRYSQRWISYFDKRRLLFTDDRIRPRHLSTGKCLCQFIEEHFRNVTYDRKTKRKHNQTTIIKSAPLELDAKAMVAPKDTTAIVKAASFSPKSDRKFNEEKVQVPIMRKNNVFKTTSAIPTLSRLVLLKDSKYPVESIPKANHLSINMCPDNQHMLNIVERMLYLDTVAQRFGHKTWDIDNFC